MVRDMNIMEVAEFIGRLKKNHDNDHIKELKAAGWTNKNIASMYGVSDRTIRNRLKSMDKQASIEKGKYTGARKHV